MLREFQINLKEKKEFVKVIHRTFVDVILQTQEAIAEIYEDM